MAPPLAEAIQRRRRLSTRRSLIGPVGTAPLIRKRAAVSPRSLASPPLEKPIQRLPEGSSAKAEGAPRPRRSTAATGVKRPVARSQRERKVFGPSEETQSRPCESSNRREISPIPSGAFQSSGLTRFKAAG